ncbi:MAG: lipid-A-disaccharide synthase N-terminal domain-containing protein [Tannerellaceae bacterium]|nr:lipid-A-disaccharide synthase N-terminal domain-containing protein [Tannerellaceae bacterium]
MYIIGLLAQVFFSARMLIQWLMSEKAKKVVSPALYWVCSIIGAYLLCIYGWMRNDFSIIMGQFIAYYIYIWNLNEKGIWSKIHVVFRTILLATPLVAALFVLYNSTDFVANFLKTENIPWWLIVFGSAGQIIFTLRFVYQWYYSHKRGESVLPIGFWLISLLGSSMITIYGIIRLDPILILGQSTGFLAYSRNILIYRKQKKLNV